MASSWSAARTHGRGRLRPRWFCDARTVHHASGAPRVGAGHQDHPRQGGAAWALADEHRAASASLGGELGPSRSSRPTSAPTSPMTRRSLGSC
eukprot:scaffold52988_cov68-Phaeocystis_antarctica.AAC.16